MCFIDEIQQHIENTKCSLQDYTEKLEGTQGRLRDLLTSHGLWDGHRSGKCSDACS